MKRSPGLELFCNISIISFYKIKATSLPISLQVLSAKGKIIKVKGLYVPKIYTQASNSRGQICLVLQSKEKNSD